MTLFSPSFTLLACDPVSSWRKRAAALLLWATLLSTVSLMGADISPASPVLLDNFNGGLPENWKVDSAGGSVTVEAPASTQDKSLRLKKTAAGQAVSASRTFPAIRGRVAVEIKVRVEESAGSETIFSLGDSGTGGTPMVVLRDGKMMAPKEKSLHEVQPLEANVWHLLRLEIDTESDQYDFSVNGVTKLSAVPLPQPVSDISQFSCAMKEGAAGTVYVDHLAVFPLILSPLQGSYLLNEMFNGQTTGKAAEGWTSVSGVPVATVEEIPFAADKSLKLPPAGSITKSFAPTRGKMVVEAKVRSEDIKGIKQLPSLFSSDQTGAVTIAFDGDKITASVADKFTDVQPFQAGVWYIIRLELDPATHTYDLYVDGMKKLTRAAFKKPVSDLAAITFAQERSEGPVYGDNIRIYSLAGLIGKPPEPVFDVKDYGAVGDGTTLNTAALQKAIDACAGSGGSVVLSGGTFLSGTIVLKSGMTLFIDSSATLLGSPDNADYPDKLPPTVNVNLSHLRRALIYAENASNIRIDGGGVINGNGSLKQWRMNGNEKSRPMLIYPVLCRNMTVQNIYLKDSAMWGFVPMETNYLTIRNLCMESRDYGNRDGIDLVDTHHVLIENCTRNTDDDIICPKSGLRSGLDDITVRNCYLATSVRANGIKFGTVSYGQLKNALFEDILIKNCDKSAIALESVDGSDISHVTFRRIELHQTNSPFFVVIGRRGRTPPNDTFKIGSIENILFEDIIGKDLKSKIGCPITGLVHEGKEYRLKNLTFRRCHFTFQGGVDKVPPHPPEMEKQYPECNIWGNMPAYGYFIRHADNVTFDGCTSKVSSEDARPWRVTEDVTGLTDQ
jgi:hypothetical protein